jgi:hypothetical protein
MQLHDVSMVCLKYTKSMKSTTPQSKSVRLTVAEIEEVRKIAVELGVTEHFIRHYAIRHFSEQWRTGWRPRKTKRMIKDLEP